MTRIKRFTPAQRLFHLLLMLSIVTQAATGLCMMYIEIDWGRTLAAFFGGYKGALKPISDSWSPSHRRYKSVEPVVPVKPV